MKEPSNMEEFRTNLEMYKEIAKMIEILSSPHIMWYTHKNPYGCWICDSKQALRQLVDEVETVLYPSPVLDTA